MIKNVNYIIRTNNDKDGITDSIIEELSKKLHLGKGIILDCSQEGINRKRDVEYWSGDVVFKHDALRYYEAVDPLDSITLKEMLPYKNMAMHIMMRESNYDMYERKYLEDVYYRILKFWNSVINNYDIRLVINVAPPHHCGEYILYALCSIKKIPYVFLHPQISAKGVYSGLGTSWEKLGISIKENYLRKIEDNITENDLSEYIYGAYIKTKNSIIMQSGDVDKLYLENRKQFLKYTSIKNIALDFLKYLYASLIYNNEISYEIKKTEYKRRLLSRIKARSIERKMDHLKEYKDVSVAPDYSKKYIYFALQMTPEASTMPQAGEFKNQLLSIEILSSVAEKLGINIYVKEHWVQVNREKGFYKRLSQLPNVSLIDIKTNSIELIKNSVAVSTQTGNVIFESLIKQKPAIVFGEGYLFKGAPNVIEVNDLSTLKEDITRVLNEEFVVEEANVLRYLKAMDEEMVYCYMDSLSETGDKYNKTDTSKKIVDYLLKYNDFVDEMKK